MTGNGALMARVRAAADLIRAKRCLAAPLPALERLRTVGQISSIRQQLNPDRPAVPFPTQKPEGSL
ncbi:hypothetical protein ACLIKD_06770 [Azonexus sp. IMCC34842]|uniref:hypothetical protein n=1 Tax=Azonexus sp. IMCC34842 TaxID=3420950 RepID=UPI003D11F05B